MNLAQSRRVNSLTEHECAIRFAPLDAVNGVGRDLTERLPESGATGRGCKHGPIYVSLPDDEDVFTISLNRAIALVDTKTA